MELLERSGMIRVILSPLSGTSDDARSWAQPSAALGRLLAATGPGGSLEGNEVWADPLCRLAVLLCSMSLDDLSGVVPETYWHTGGMRKKLDRLLPNTNRVLKTLKLSRSQEHRVLTMVGVGGLVPSLAKSGMPDHTWMSILSWHGGRAAFAIAWACSVQTGDTPLEVVEEFCERAWAVSPDQYAPEPLLTGEDLRSLGMLPGPEFKKILRELRAAQLDGLIRSRDEALRWLEK